MNEFEYNGNRVRVVFGSGTVGKLPGELARIRRSRPLLLSNSTVDLLGRGFWQNTRWAIRRYFLAMRLCTYQPK